MKARLDATACELRDGGEGGGGRGGRRMNAGSKTNFPLSATRMIMWMAFGTFWIRFRVWDCERLRGVKENTCRE